ncbi:polysaccharide biosynthesis/export family protein [Thalassotalea sp. PS06]|uniref:polysaccharide biosynthesis/export family protein n=1 Tax=Thalassotalea sp. PS06 TaxID=2594005 RepID=UPI001162FF3B|nr:polysaccharide biosynthesis/export family protein [Thalassotalea sp. PS06]QDP00653.1 polysaccharide export protein [Thalassotalea sp. PS06]
MRANQSFNTFSSFAYSTIFLIVLLAFSSNLFAQEAGEYRIDSGDKIAIEVYGEPELSREMLLNDSGKINYPFLGEITIQGLTLYQVEQKIHQGLKGDYLINPNVSVSIITYRPFFIDGEVKKPGGYPYQPGLTVAKAAAVAGGFTERASLEKIFIVKSGLSDKTPQPIDLHTLIGPGDIISIKQSFF